MKEDKIFASTNKRERLVWLVWKVSERSWHSAEATVNFDT